MRLTPHLTFPLDWLEKESFTHIMALRVLLADESTTIKKVMQLALQDYGVEVKSVPVGLDVIPVATAFKPDIIFVDVLLQKRSGYEVARDLKMSPQFRSVPVVLMWSGFMELDEAKASEARVERRLEKPFDAEILRNLIRELVPKTQANRISDYLTFPTMPEFSEEPRSTESITSPPPGPGEEIFGLPELGEGEELPTFAKELATPPDADEFATVSLTAGSKAPPPKDNWSHQDLSKFKIPVPNEPTGEFEKFMIPAEELNLANVESSGDFEEVTFSAPTKSAPKPTGATTKGPAYEPEPKASPKLTATQEVMAEKILREEALAMIEKIAWQILPDICERVVREELNRLLKDVEKNI